MAQIVVFFCVLAAFLASYHALVRLPMEKHVIPGMQGRGLIPVTVMNLGIRYTVPVGFGSDNTQFNLVVDTGSTNIWVGSPDCQSCGFKNTHRCENPSEHTTTVSYLAGFGSGHFCKEDLRISGMTIRDQEFLTIEEGKALANTKVGDGIIGFGPESGSFGYPVIENSMLTVHKPHSVMRNLYDQGLIETPTFSLYMSRHGESELIIGGVDKDFYIGEVTFTTPVDDKSWTIAVDGVGIGDTVVCGPGECTALPDTGTPDAVAIPYKYTPVLDRQMLRAGAKKSKVNSQSLVDGNNFLFYTYSLTPYTNIDLLPNFYFTISGMMFVITGRDYVDKGLINLSVNSAVQHFILGDYFLHKVYTTYDLANRKVGFAYARH